MQFTFYDCVKRPSSSLCRLRRFKIVYFTLHYITLNSVFGKKRSTTSHEIDAQERYAELEDWHSEEREPKPTLTFDLLTSNAVTTKLRLLGRPLANAY